MVSTPSGLLTCFERFDALRTISRIAGAWALGIGLLTFGLHAALGAQNRTILVFGDSLGAGYGLPSAEGWAALLQRRLREQGYGYRIVNASISGETTSGGLQRLPRALEINRPVTVLLELGANDGLRGLPLTLIRGNLEQMIRLSEQAGARVLLLGIRLPPNYGARYTDEFAALYPELAREFSVPLVPFLLEHVALQPNLMQSDGLHPDAAGEPIVLENVWIKLKPMLEKRTPPD